MHHRVALPRRRHDLGQLLPGGQHETGVPERQFQHQRPEGLVEVAHLVGRRQPGLARQPDRAQSADRAERVPLVHLGVGERVQGHRRVAGAARPAAQRHLLGHRAGREEGGGLLAEQPGGPLLQGLDDPVAVDVRTARPGRTTPAPRRAAPAAARSSPGTRGAPGPVRRPGARPGAATAAPCPRPAPRRDRRPVARLFGRIAHARDHAVRGFGRSRRISRLAPSCAAGVRAPTACGQPDAPRTDRVNMTRNRPVHRPVPRADWNGRPPSSEYIPTARPQGPSRPAHRRRRRRRPGRPRAGRLPATRRAPSGGRLRGLRRLRAPSRRTAPRRAAGRTPAEVLARADLVLLTVPDDALPGLVEGLAETGAVRPGQLLVHTSGRYGTKVLDPALRAGALPLALHPAMTFTGTPVDVQRLAGCSFGVTAPRRAAAGRRGARHRDGRRARVDRRGDPPALPRGPRPRREPPGHPGRPVHGAAARRPASTPPTGCSARCSAPPWTTRCAPATRR